MTERPILFSGAMVRAILEGRKTQTRRTIKVPRWADSSQDFEIEHLLGDGPLWPVVISRKTGCPVTLDCPYGQPGDQLWVRETWADVNSEEGPAIAYRADSGIQTWHDFSETFGPDYGAGPSMDYEAYPGLYCMWWSDLLNGVPDHGWRPSVHMPRWASRITLEVVSVRVERLTQISNADAVAEGIEPDGADWRGPSRSWCTAAGAFCDLWDSINGKTNPWQSNPWVWVVEFRRLA